MTDPAPADPAAGAAGDGPAPRISRDQLLLWSIAALRQIAHAAPAERIAPSFSLKAILGLLFALGDGDRRPYDGFWRAACQKPAGAGSEAELRYIRKSALYGWVGMIEQSLGVRNDILFEAAIEAAMHAPNPNPWRRTVEAVAHEKAARAERAERRRRGRDCGWL